MQDLDLFNIYDELPIPVQDILATFNTEDCKYAQCSRVLAELEYVGYTFDWDLDGIPFNLQKIKK